MSDKSNDDARRSNVSTQFIESEEESSLSDASTQSNEEEFYEPSTIYDVFQDIIFLQECELWEKQPRKPDSDEDLESKACIFLGSDWKKRKRALEGDFCQEQMKNIVMEYFCKGFENGTSMAFYGDSETEDGFCNFKKRKEGGIAQNLPLACLKAYWSLERLKNNGKAPCSFSGLCGKV